MLFNMKHDTRMLKSARPHPQSEHRTKAFQMLESDKIGKQDGWLCLTRSSLLVQRGTAVRYASSCEVLERGPQIERLGCLCGHRLVRRFPALPESV